VKDSTDPAWTTSFILNYHFEAHQEVRNNGVNLSPSPITLSAVHC
jgi:hypothetical protein